MVSHSIHISIDPSLKQSFIDAVGVGNISKTLISFIEDTVGSKDTDARYVKIKLVKHDIERLRKDIIQSKSSLQKNMLLLKKYDKLKEKEKTNKLKREQALIDSRKCFCCGDVIDESNPDKWITKTGQWICKKCFLSADREMRNRWGITI